MLLLIFCLSTANFLAAQETRGTILGKAKDPAGAVVPGVEFLVTNVGTNAGSRTLINDAGLYEVPLLISGDYEVSAEIQGFKKFVRRGITLNIGSRVVIDISLEIGQRAETVTLPAEEPLMEVTTASSGQVFDRRSIGELPVLNSGAMLMSGPADGMQRGSHNYLGPHSAMPAFAAGHISPICI